jgi:hypothetical protein
MCLQLREQPTAFSAASKLLLSIYLESCGRYVKMLWTIFVVLLVLWLLGLVSSYTMGGFIHILLVLALVVLVIQLITGRRAAL